MGLVTRLRKRRDGDGYWGGKARAQYSYGIWLKHIALLHECGMPFPESIAELGPGDSIGAGVAALLCGARSYHAYDVLPFARPTGNDVLVDDMALLLRERTPRPFGGWPDLDPVLGPASFPTAALPDAQLEASLTPKAVQSVREAVHRLELGAPGPIRYFAPWDNSEVSSGPYDLCFSHTVLEYVGDLPSYFSRCAAMLKPGGWMSHQIDLTSLGITRAWNGHLGYSRAMWQVVLGRRAWGPNRQSPHDYLSALEQSGFDLVWSSRRTRSDGLKRAALASEFRRMPEQDLDCYGLFLIARRRDTA